jgi:LPPG:FO 2-phospho-L-lactate transferase
MLAIPGLREALRDAPGPVVAVSPLVRGESVKGPTAECLRWAGRTRDSDGIAAHYAGLIDGLVADQRASNVPTLETDVDMAGTEARRRVARDVLAFADALG